MAYKALVCRIRGLRPIPDADRIQLATVGAYQIIVGNDVEEGQLGVFFEQGGQLSQEFATTNDLVKRKLEDGSQAGGMFEENRRVKAIKLKGCKSEGFWCPLTNFAYTGYDTSVLKEGDQFEELNGHAICNKYFTPATQRSMKSSGRQQPENPMFKKHIETGQYKREANMIPPGALIIITEKLHGTSFRYGHVLQIEPPSLWQERVVSFICRLLKRTAEWRRWKHLNGSRNVVLDRPHSQGYGYHGREDFRRAATKDIVLHKGEVLYGELVGYTEDAVPIMAPQSTVGLKDKKVQQAFGDEIIYRYGTIPGQCKLYVYRITQVNEDGIVVELSWDQVQARSRELGLATVPVLSRFIYDGDQEKLTNLIVQMTDVDAEKPEALPSNVDPTHIQEGVVVRYESEYGTGWLKNKSFVFGRLEGYLKDKDEYVDLEEAA